MISTGQANIRIALFIPNFMGGGAERVTAALANGFVVRGYQTDMVLIDKVGPYLADLHPTVRVIDLHKKTVRNSILPLARYLCSQKPDFLLSNLDYANVGALLARRLARVATRVIPIVHMTHSQAAAHNRDIHNTIVRTAIRWTYPWADAIVAVSKGAAEDMIKYSHVPRSLVRVIYNPVITPKLQSLAREPIDHPWFAEGKPPVVLAIGRLTAQKDFSTLLQAFARLSQKKNCRLLIFGEGEDRNYLEQIIRNLGLTNEIALPGFVKNPYAYLARASVFVLSSAWEGLSMVLIEALALGVPLVSTDCPSGPTEIIRGGKYGRLVPAGDAQAMGDAIQMALTEPNPTVPPEVLQPFTLDVALDKYENLITELIRK